MTTVKTVEKLFSLWSKLKKNHPALYKCSFGFNNNKRRLGVARFGKNPRIEISKRALGLGDKVLHNTLRHEAAHIISGYSAGHGNDWKEIARQIGCDGERVASVSMPETNHNWEIHCPMCAHEYVKEQEDSSSKEPIEKTYIIARYFRRPKSSIWKKRQCLRCKQPLRIVPAGQKPLLYKWKLCCTNNTTKHCSHSNQPLAFYYRRPKNVSNKICKSCRSNVSLHRV